MPSLLQKKSSDRSRSVTRTIVCRYVIPMRGSFCGVAARLERYVAPLRSGERKAEECEDAGETGSPDDSGFLGAPIQLTGVELDTGGVGACKSCFIPSSHSQRWVWCSASSSMSSPI